MIRKPTSTDAYVHRGMWVADCPYPACGNCEPLKPRAVSVYCRECHWIGSVVWPKDVQGINDALCTRPVPGTRHWAPAGHRQAIACGFPDGQSVDDLLEENRVNL